MVGKFIVFAALIAVAVVAEPIEIEARATSSSSPQSSCVPCSPSGWTTINPPAVGSSDFANMYTDLVETVQGIHFQTKRNGHWWEEHLARRASTPPICCAQNTQCLLVVNLNIPMCYDKFTTNFLFPDNSYGTIATGNYVSSNGASANLIQGNYSSGGSTGNVYTSDTSAKPNAATLPIPSQYTGTGVGSAIAASNLGIGYSYLLQTITGPTTIPEKTISGSVVPAMTFSGSATITVSTSTITHSTAGATPTTKSAAGSIVHAPSRALEKVLATLLGASILAILAL